MSPRRGHDARALGRAHFPGHADRRHRAVVTMPRVLIVEDDPDIALGLEQDLRLECYQLELVTDSQAAVTRGLTGGFDLILLDVMPPGMDGFLICRELPHARLRTATILP